jgi:FxsC-like protein
MPLDIAHAHVGDPPYFFLSYARTPRYDLDDQKDPAKWVHKLYNDLCATIIELITGRIPGFMDRDMHVGDEWQRKVADALATCRVFVPLYSPRYFTSEFCGKEWSAFALRVLSEKARNPDITVAIVPALWVPVEEDALPSVARSIQFRHEDLGDRYCREGFFGIMKLSRYRDDYMVAVQRLARRIVAVAKQNEISPGPQVDIVSLPDAFHGGIAIPTGRSAGKPAAAGTPVTGSADAKDMRLTVVAPDLANVPEGRSSVYYGERPRDWCPYFPDIRQPITDYAAGLTEYFGCRPNVASFDEHLKHLLNGPGAPGLYIIDAWAARNPFYCEQLKHIDELNQHWTSVLLPWNMSDQETTEAERELRRDLRAYLSRKLADIPHKFREAAVDIQTLQEFAHVMTGMAMQMLRRFLKDVPPNPPPGGPQGERPRLRPPGSEE